MTRLPRQASSDPLTAAFTQAVERQLNEMAIRIVLLEAALASAGVVLPNITGPAILGRQDGTGQPVAITLGPGFSIVDGELRYTSVVIP